MGESIVAEELMLGMAGSHEGKAKAVSVDKKGNINPSVSDELAVGGSVEIDSGESLNIHTLHGLSDLSDYSKLRVMVIWETATSGEIEIDFKLKRVGDLLERDTRSITSARWNELFDVETNTIRKLQIKNTASSPRVIKAYEVIGYKVSAEGLSPNDLQQLEDGIRGVKDEIANFVPTRQRSIVLLERETRSEGSYPVPIELPKDAYGVVLHLITHDWEEDSGASAQIRARSRFGEYSTFGYITDKVLYDDLSGGKSSRLPSIESMYLCPEALYLKEYPPQTGGGASSVRFLQLTAHPVRLSNSMIATIVIEGTVECSLFCEFLT